MEQQPETTETRVTLLESRADKLEQRVTTHGEEIDAAAAQLHELSIRAHYRDESMGELKAMGKQTAEALDDLRQSFAAERVENKNRFDQRDATQFKEIKGYVISAVVAAMAGFVLARMGLG
jgi:hypothetical protein